MKQKIIENGLKEFQDYLKDIGITVSDQLIDRFIDEKYEKETDLSIYKVMKEVSIFTKTKITDIQSKSRKDIVKDARHMYLFFCFKHVKDNVDQISYYANTHRTSIYHAQKRCLNEFDIKKMYDDFEKYMMLSGYSFNYIDRKIGNKVAVNSIRIYHKQYDPIRL